MPKNENENLRTPERVLILGCTAFAGIDSVNWRDQVVPNIPDYDLVVVSVPHITEDFLMSVRNDYLKEIRKSLVRFLDSGGKLLVLVSAGFSIHRPSKYPEHVSNTDWCPITYKTPQENGKSIIIKQNEYREYLKIIFEWKFYFKIPRGCISNELSDFYDVSKNPTFKVPFKPYLENRYGHILAGYFHVEIRYPRRKRVGYFDETRIKYSETPDFTTGTVVLLPLIGKVSPEEALAKILHDEIGISLESPEPDWAQSIEMPGVPELVHQVEEAQSKIRRETEKVQDLEAKISDIRSFRRLLYGTGSELEAIVKRSLEQLGATVSPSKYSQEEYILEFEGNEFLMEVKGVSKSIALSHLRQLNDYLLKYQEDTGKDCKGILFGNAWRNAPLDMRGGREDTQEFPDNVVRRAEQWGISLVSSTAFFAAFVKALENPQKANYVLMKLQLQRESPHLVKPYNSCREPIIGAIWRSHTIMFNEQEVVIVITTTRY